MIKMPAVIMERSKLSRPMWKALKTHIVRERQRKKQEQEADAEVERQRREREDQQKEQEMTLEETKEQVAQSESRLAQLKEDKHQLFLQLKKVLNEDDTRRKIRESNFNSDMMLVQGYPPGAPIAIHPNHGPALYMHNVGPTRPVYKIKEEPIGSIAPPPLSLYTPSISLIPPQQNHQGSGNQKRSRSPSPPPAQMYHPYKAQVPSPYNPKSVGIPYGTSSAAPGSIFYAPSVSVSSAHSAAAAIGYPPPPGSLYSYPPGLSSSSRPQYSNQAPVVSKDDGLSAQKHHAAIYLGHGSSSQMPSRPIAFSVADHVPRSSGAPMTQAAGYLHQSMEHLMSKSSNYPGSSEAEKFYMSAHGPAPAGSSSVTSSSSVGLRPHAALLAPIGPPGSSHASGISIQLSNHAKSGSITSGHPLRPPPSTGPYHTTIASSHGQSPRLVYTQSGGQPPTQPRYFGNPN